MRLVRRRESHDDQAHTPDVELEEYVSQQLVCPISHHIMDFPVITPSGHTYDLSSISAWLRRRSIDPLSSAPLAPSSLYPNRAVQVEIVAQLERVSAEALAHGNNHLAAAAQMRLNQLKELRGEAIDNRDRCRVDQMTSFCARNVAMWGLIASEQVLVFTTSFGALLCLLYDSIKALRFRAASVTSGEVARPLPLLSAFVRLTLSPVTLPSHWGHFSWFTVISLRSALVLPLCPMLLAFVAGALSSLTRFAQRCTEDRAVEQERVAGRQWFLHTIATLNSIAGFSSLGLFLRLLLDRSIVVTGQ